MTLPKRKRIEFRTDERLLINTVADFYHVTVENLRGPQRRSHIIIPRHVAMYFLRYHTDMSLETIGKEFGGRDHTTVLHACQSVRESMKHDGDFHRQVDYLENRLVKVGALMTETAQQHADDIEIENLVGLA